MCAEPRAAGQVDLVMGTFGKALGSYGAFVAGSVPLRDWLVNRCRGFIYSTALAPPLAAAALKALELLPGLDARRAHLLRQAGRARAALRRLGIDTLASDTQIIPAVIGTDADTLATSRTLEAEGVLAVAIRPPTVPPGTGRLQLSLSAGA
jgi:8-amino-7-oxononanoate synthase